MASKPKKTYNDFLEPQIAQSREHDAFKFDIQAPVSELVWDNQCRLMTPDAPEHDGRDLPSALTPTDFAYRQMFHKLGRTVFKSTHKSLPYDYYMAIAPDQRAYNLQRHCKDATNRTWKVRGYKDTMRAAVDSRFPGGPDENGDYENTQLLAMFQYFLDQEREKFPDFRTIRPSVTSDELRIKMLWRDISPKQGGGGNYGIGVYAQDFELGGGTRGKIMPCIQRHSCENSIIVTHDGSAEWAHQHFGSAANSLAAKRIQIKLAIGEALKIAAETMERVLVAEEVKLDDFSSILDGLALEYGWSTEVKTKVAIGTEGRETIMGIVNGVTFAAHTAFDAVEAQTEMEKLGGVLLFQSKSDFAEMAISARQIQAGMKRAAPRQLSLSNDVDYNN